MIVNIANYIELVHSVEPLYSGHPWGTTFWPLYTGVAFIEGLFCTQTVHLGPGCLAVIAFVTQACIFENWWHLFICPPSPAHSGEGSELHSKKELIQTARMIAKESEEVVKMAKKIADACTDKRMKRVRYFVFYICCSGLL